MGGRGVWGGGGRMSVMVRAGMRGRDEGERKGWW